MDPSTPPLDAFARYLRRRLAEEQRPPPAVVGASGEGRLRTGEVPAGTEIAFVRVEEPTGRDGPLPPIDAGGLAALGASSGLSTRFAGPGYALLDRFDPLAVGPAPASYRVLAILTTFNEADIVAGLIDRLLADGIDVHVIDNWSSDGTAELVAGRLALGRCTMERYPAAGPSPYFELSALLRRVEQVAHGSGAKWVIHHDCDEIRQPPWPGVGLRQAFYAIEQFGFNCVDHTVLNFLPVDDSFRAGEDLEAHFRFFEFGDVSAHFQEQKAWMPQPEPVEIASTGGHEAAFEGRRVFPYKFLLRHYSIRSQAHGERKIFRERRGRFHPGERARGWHIHYDAHLPGSSFLRDPAGLLDADDLDGRHLLQRLSGAGLAGNPHRGEGPDGEARPLSVLLRTASDAPPAAVRIQLSLAPLPPGTLSRTLESIRRTVASFSARHPDAIVDLAIADRSSAPALAGHQLEALSASFAAIGARGLCYEHAGRGADERADERLISSAGARSELVLLTDGWCHLSPQLLTALVEAIGDDVGAAFPRQLPIEADLASGAAPTERWPEIEGGLARSCVLVRDELLSLLDGSVPKHCPARPADLVGVVHEAGQRVAYVPAAPYLRDEPFAGTLARPETAGAPG